jgi:hypothetical protein
MKLRIVQLSPFSRYFIPLRSKYFPQHHVIKHPVYAVPLTWETKFHTHTKEMVELRFCVF